MEREEAATRCRAVVERIHSLPLSKFTSSSSKSTLLRLLHSELLFLSRPPSPSSYLSCNVTYIEAIVHILQHPSINGVSGVCKLIHTPSKSKQVAAHVDIVCTFHKQPSWFIVSTRNPNYISWDSCGKIKGLRLRIHQLIRAARSSGALMPSLVVLFFANGLPLEVRNKLIQEFGFRELKLGFSYFDFTFVDGLDGDWVDVLSNSYKGACTLVMDIGQSSSSCQSLDCMMGLSPTNASRRSIGKENELSCGVSFSSLILNMKEWPLDVKDSPSHGQVEVSKDEDLINFDTTALIAIVSGISNGAANKVLASPENELRQRFKNNTEFVLSQALAETKSPLLAELSCHLSGKSSIACKSVYLEFMELVSMCGGPNEQRRADQLVKLIRIVPDSPSARMICLPTTRKLGMKNKIAFGTGDFWGSPTLTANVGFVRAVSQAGMSLFAIVHRPCALVGD